MNSAQYKFGTSGTVHGGEARTNMSITKAKYNFIVHFELGEVAKQMLRELHGTDKPLGALTSYVIKDIDKPGFTMQTDTVNQYNRSRLVPGKITYDPVNMALYDTIDSAAMLLIDAYRRYYYGDFSDKSLKSWQYDTVSTPRLFEYFQPLLPNDFEQGDPEDEMGDYTWGRSVYNMGDQDNGYFFKRIDIYEIDGSVYTVHNIHNPVIESVKLGTKTHESEGEPSLINLTFKHEGISNICPLTLRKAISKPTAELVPLIDPLTSSEFSPMGFFKYWGEMDDTPINEFDPNTVKGFPDQRGFTDDLSATSILAMGKSAVRSVGGVVSAVTDSSGLVDTASNVSKALTQGTALSSAAGSVASAGDAVKSIGGLF